MKKLIGNNWDAFVAFIFTWVAPLAFLIMQAVHFYKGSDTRIEIKFCLAGCLVLGIALIIYFKKLKKWIAKKIDHAEIRGLPKNPIYVFLNGLMTILALVFGIMVVILLEAFCGSVKDYLCIITIFEIIGSIFSFVHACRQTV